MLHHVYLSPGMFGFGRLASYDYFTHVERALKARIEARGEQIVIHVAHVAPTASIRRRALKLTELVASTCDAGNPDGGPIHLIGHSTGGLDARLVASPSAALAGPAGALAWRQRLVTVTTINTPHYGTPLASFFTTASGQRALGLLSALTVIALSFGSPPLAVARAIVAAFSGVDRSLGLKVEILDRATDSLLHLLDDVRGGDLREYVDEIAGDQGAMVQLMPEAMDLFIAGVEDRPGVLYRSTASMAPPPSARILLPELLRPWSAMSGTVFAALYAITSRLDHRYPCAAPDAGADSEATLARTFGRSPGARANDGAVPIRSQIWGDLVWAGYGDHLDVLGHFRETRPTRAEGGARRASLRGATQTLAEPPHVDWLYSGSAFGCDQFESLMDAIASGLTAGGPSQGARAH
jgi:triacylglycerol lipase